MVTSRKRKDDPINKTHYSLRKTAQLLDITEKEAMELLKQNMLKWFLYDERVVRVCRYSIYKYMGINPNLKLYSQLITDFYVTIIRGMGKYGLTENKIRECFKDAVKLVFDEDEAASIPRKEYVNYHDYKQQKRYRRMLKKCQQN